MGGGIATFFGGIQMKRLIGVFLCVAAVICLVHCCGNSTVETSENEPWNRRFTADSGYLKIMETAMYEIKEYLGEPGGGFASIELSDELSVDKERLYEQLDELFDAEGYTTMHYSIEELQMYGYADRQGNLTPGGVHISLEEWLYTPTELIVELKLYHSPLGASSSLYSAERENISWEVINIERTVWIA